MKTNVTLKIFFSYYICLIFFVLAKGAWVFKHADPYSYYPMSKRFCSNLGSLVNREDSSHCKPFPFYRIESSLDLDYDHEVSPLPVLPLLKISKYISMANKI